MSVLKNLLLHWLPIRRLQEGRDNLLRDLNAAQERIAKLDARIAALEAEQVATPSDSSLVEVIQHISVLAKRPLSLGDDALQRANQMPRLAEALRSCFDQMGVPALPPEALQRRVVGEYVHQFLVSASGTINDFNVILSRNFSRTIGDFSDVFDFGVGCGRVIRRMAEIYPNIRLTGGDIDAEAIQWLSDNYASLGKFVTLPHRPASTISDASFDLVYGISVFTHLPEDMQFEWLRELHRVTKPGAVLLLSLHGENYLRLFPEQAQAKAAANGGFFYNDDAGLTSGLPEFYKNAYHTREYVARHWAEYFELVDYRPLGLEGHQDVVVCRHR